jgi:hypothetical protein
LIKLARAPAAVYPQRIPLDSSAKLSKNPDATVSRVRASKGPAQYQQPRGQTVPLAPRLGVTRLRRTRWWEHWNKPASDYATARGCLIS